MPKESEFARKLTRAIKTIDKLVQDGLAVKQALEDLKPKEEGKGEE